jgi:hypothetical protein
MADPAAYVQAQIDEWHSRLKAGGSARPSPTIEVAQRAGQAGPRAPDRPVPSPNGRGFARPDSFFFPPDRPSRLRE